MAMVRKFHACVLVFLAASVVAKDCQAGEQCGQATEDREEQVLLQGHKAVAKLQLHDQKTNVGTVPADETEMTKQERKAAKAAAKEDRAAEKKAVKAAKAAAKEAKVKAIYTKEKLSGPPSVKLTSVGSKQNTPKTGSWRVVPAGQEYGDTDIAGVIENPAPLNDDGGGPYWAASCCDGENVECGEVTLDLEDKYTLTSATLVTKGWGVACTVTCTFSDAFTTTFSTAGAFPASCVGANHVRAKGGGSCGGCYFDDIHVIRNMEAMPNDAGYGRVCKHSINHCTGPKTCAEFQNGQPVAFSGYTGTVTCHDSRWKFDMDQYPDYEMEGNDGECDSQNWAISVVCNVGNEAA